MTAGQEPVGRCRDEASSRANTPGSPPGAQARHRRGKSPYPGSSLHLPAELGSVERPYEKREVPGSTPGAGTQEWGARRSPCGDGPAARPAPGTTEPGHVPPSPLQHMDPWSSGTLTALSRRRRRFDPGRVYAPRRHSRPQRKRSRSTPFPPGVRATSERENPPRPRRRRWPSRPRDADVAQQVERQASNLDVAGSIPVVRSRCRGTGRPDAACRWTCWPARTTRRLGVASRVRADSSRPWDLGTASTFRRALLATRPNFGLGGRRFEPGLRSEGARSVTAVGGWSLPLRRRRPTGSAATRPYPREGAARAPQPGGPRKRMPW